MEKTEQSPIGQYISQKIMHVLWTVEYTGPKLIAATAVPDLLLVTAISWSGYMLDLICHVFSSCHYLSHCYSIAWDRL